MADPAAPHYGYDLMKAAGSERHLYPMLARLQQEGLVESQWEDQRPDAGGRDRRSKYYRLTAEGARAARLELADGLNRAGPDAAGGGAARARNARKRV